jgi:hypothetical protein
MKNLNLFGVHFCVATLAFVSFMPCAANAAPIINLNYIQPFNTAASTDEIPIYVNVTIDPASESVVDYLADSSARIAEFETELSYVGFDLNTGITFSYTRYITCSAGLKINTFLGPRCQDGPYSRNAGPQVPFGAPGSSTDILFATFVPKGGSAPEGIYTFYDLGFSLLAEGSDSNGEKITRSLSYLQQFGVQASGGVPFVRKIGPVPEPATWALMLAGFGAVGYSMRRRNVAVSFA